MMNARLITLGLIGFLPLAAQVAPVALPEVTVYSPRVANQSAAASFAMPVSSLRFEPRVDIQARNLTEAQADVTIRGGIFENTGFRLGAVTLSDPQTGHYYAEIPVAPMMLGAPEILTGADHALVALNSTVGAVAYAWRPVRTAGVLSFAAGDHGMNREDFYEGYVSDAALFGERVAADVSWGRSESNGAVAFGDSHFDRVTARLQLAGGNSQTDLFAGYQAKFFGWPNLYTPFNSDESENLETLLFALNHRVDLGAGDFFEAGIYHRRNKDDYAFNRFAPLGPVHPFQHTTWVTGAGAGGRRDLGALALNFHGEILSDDLHSTSLTAGKFHSRTLAKLAVVPEKSWSLDGGARVVAKAGATWDHSDRDGSVLSPVFELAREQATGPVQRIYASYATTTQLPSYTALNSSASSGLFRGNPDLGRETSRNLELGLASALGGWNLEAAVFHRQDENLVDWTFKRGVTARTANAVDVDTTGAEFVARKSWRAFDLVIGYTVLTKSPDYRGAAVDASFYALNYARQRLTAAIVARLGREFEVRLDNAARIQAGNLLRTTGGDRAVISSLGLAYRPVALPRTEFTVLVDNLWDSAFQEVPAVPAAGRQYSAGIAYAW
ncbi:MAG: TonB-dependent receptor [Verrucomicrobia bacterium]|nr:TonB-dependent receptor [Verrucomicrobiota bacterium]